MTPVVKRWLHGLACAEYQKDQADLDETQRMHDLYAARNRGEDGYKPGIWYQEQELATCLMKRRPEVEFLRSVVDELREPPLRCVHPSFVLRDGRHFVCIECGALMTVTPPEEGGA